MPFKDGNVLSWATDVDGNTMAQAQRSASLPFVAGHVALMPDAHFGYGATVGSVIPTKGAIIPSAVGVDIGCGMIAAAVGRGSVPLMAHDLPDDLSELHALISKGVPSGVGKGHDDGDNYNIVNKWMPEWPTTKSDWGKDWEKKALTQFGSLGSGNHFVEVCLDENDHVWVVLHSGSRGIGNVAANKHIDGAKADMKRMFINLPDPDLAYLVQGTPEFDAYITDMLWAQDYAMGNREAMLSRVMKALTTFMRTSLHIDDRINCHHNFTEMENHNGQNLWITRKGAIRARQDDRGVIPGSMGARSYIVRGNGVASSYCSCSHGAGRKMSRGEAKRNLDRDTLIKQMEGITWNNNVDALIDEDPRAYKDIDQVMENQKDLVTIEHTLHQILNYKGA